VADFDHIVGSLLFPPVPGSQELSTIYATSHLFFLGDLNFRLDIPASHALSSLRKTPQFGEFLSSEEKREEIRHFDQLTVEKMKGTIFTGFHEGEFWKFKCSYKYKLGEVDRFEYVSMLLR